jgi:hypothetical protein
MPPNPDAVRGRLPPSSSGSPHPSAHGYDVKGQRVQTIALGTTGIEWRRCNNKGGPGEGYGKYRNNEPHCKNQHSTCLSTGHSTVRCPVKRQILSRGCDVHYQPCR